MLAEKFLEDYIKQSLLPLALPINQDTLKALKDDKRKIVLTIMEDENDERSKGLVKLLKAAASANRDLVFAFFGFKQWQDFAESFEVSKKTKLPKMIVWDGDEEYSSVSLKLSFPLSLSLSSTVVLPSKVLQLIFLKKTTFACVLLHYV